MLAQLLLVAFASSLASTQIPYSRTPAAELSPRGLEHMEVLRIGRDFGERNMEVVVDTWTVSTHPDAIDEVRFWWVDTDNDERSPFGRKLRKYIGMGFVPNEPDDWTVKLRGDRKEFVFDVELDASGQAHAFGDIIERDGRVIEHCRALDSRFIARRFIGIPIGLKRLEVQCVDEHGQRHQGELPFRKLPRGKLWDDA